MDSLHSQMHNTTTQRITKSQVITAVECLTIESPDSKTPTPLGKTVTFLSFKAFFF